MTFDIIRKYVDYTLQNEHPQWLATHYVNNSHNMQTYTTKLDISQISSYLIQVTLCLSTCLSPNPVSPPNLLHITHNTYLHLSHIVKQMFVYIDFWHNAQIYIRYIAKWTSTMTNHTLLKQLPQYANIYYKIWYFTNLGLSDSGYTVSYEKIFFFKNLIE